ncbi:hypothetical protein FRC17_010763 [Serendipita sp. 399]|nr:hypothetical protein FRC17_010763 [Serendipita sp. 399]
MSSIVRKTTAQAAATVSRSLKTRRSSSPILSDLPSRPIKRARTLQSQSSLVVDHDQDDDDGFVKGEESQVTLVANEVSTLVIESQTSTIVADVDADEKKPRIKAQRKKKGAVEPSVGDFPPRVSREWKVGAHISAAGGIEQAIPNAAKIGAEAFALFLKSQRQWNAKPLSKESIEGFKSRMNTFGYDFKHVFPHGSYLVNLGNPDKEKREKSYECFLDDLIRCEQVGIGLYNFHPGSTVGGCTVDESIKHIADSLNRAHKATSSVVTVVENMAGAGNVIGGTFEQLAQIIEGVEDKKRVGICLDTCHMFASGYDIRTKEAYEKTMAKFESVVGFKYLSGLHLNDSKTELGSKKDRHESLGLGHVGLRAFAFMMRDERLKGLPMVLETIVEEAWPKEIEILQRMADPTIPEDELDFDAMTNEIREEVKKHAKEENKAKKEKKEKKEKKPKAAASKSKKAKKAESDEDASEDEDD